MMGASESASMSVFILRGAIGRQQSGHIGARKPRLAREPRLATYLSRHSLWKVWPQFSSISDIGLSIVFTSSVQMLHVFPASVSVRFIMPTDPSVFQSVDIICRSTTTTSDFKHTEQHSF